jgi:hypothetical protein
MHAYTWLELASMHAYTYVCLQRIGNGGIGGGMSLMPMGGMNGFGGMSMMSNMGGGSGSMMVMHSSSFSSDGRTVHSSTTSARMGPGGVAEIQRQVSLKAHTCTYTCINLPASY